MKELDLHGLIHSDAVSQSEDYILRLSVDELFECRLITGNSLKLQTKLIVMLKKHDFKWYIPTWNAGEMIVSN
jgi:hypothetical protein